MNKQKETQLNYALVLIGFTYVGFSLGLFVTAINAGFIKLALAFMGTSILFSIIAIKAEKIFINNINEKVYN